MKRWVSTLISLAIAGQLAFNVWAASQLAQPPEGRYGVTRLGRVGIARTDARTGAVEVFNYRTQSWQALGGLPFDPDAYLATDSLAPERPPTP